MTDANEWTGRVGSAWADDWRRTDRSFGALTARLLDPAARGTFVQALDIGCGAGEVSERLAVANLTAQVLGIDISAELLEVARKRCASLANASFEEADAATWRCVTDLRPDLLVSRHGVMFFTDPTAALTHLRAEAAPGARLRFSCFRARAENGWAAALASVLPAQAPADPAAPGPFAFAQPARVEDILTVAGWRDIAFEPMDYAMIAGEGGDAVEDAVSYFQRIGPAARIMADMRGAERAATRERLRALLVERCQDGIVSLPSAAWLVTARSP